jgi:hypothetical protein
MVLLVLVHVLVVLEVLVVVLEVVAVALVLVVMQLNLALLDSREQMDLDLVVDQIQTKHLTLDLVAGEQAAVETKVVTHAKHLEVTVVPAHILEIQ